MFKMTRDQTLYDRSEQTFFFLGDFSDLKDALMPICFFVLFSLLKLGIL